MFGLSVIRGFDLLGLRSLIDGLCLIDLIGLSVIVGLEDISRFGPIGGSVIDRLGLIGGVICVLGVAGSLLSVSFE